MFPTNTFVLNFGQRAKVLEVRQNGDLILQAPGIGKWIADPSKCQLSA